MGKKKKIIPIPEETIKKIREDLGGDGVKIYELTNLPEEFISRELIHPGICHKCDSFVATVSGSHIEGREYMFIAGLRRDKNGDNHVTDIDPIGMVYDLKIGSPAPSGIALFHGNFKGRTEIDYSSTATTVKTLKGCLGDEVMSFKEAPERFMNAIHFVAKNYRDNVDDS